MSVAPGADKLIMDGLAEQAGLGKGTVFRRFGTRSGIFAALLDDDERALQQQVLAGPRHCPTSPPPTSLPIPARRADRAKLAGPSTQCHWA
jgi:AcrR family transcriptional regulator